MSRVVWTTIGIEADLTERTWVSVSEWTRNQLVSRYLHTPNMSGFFLVDGKKLNIKSLEYFKPEPCLRFEFDTDAQAIAFRLSHPDHLIDEPTDPKSEKAARVNRLNRLPRVEAIL